MKLKIEISLDNAAFEDGGTDEILEVVTAAIERLRGRWPEVPPAETHVTDSNGNKVGKAEVTR